MSTALVGTEPGNTPVIDIPLDYYPPGCGYWFEIPAGPDAGKKLFFRDSTHGTGEPAAVIVFVHGNPENSYIYRKVIASIYRKTQVPYRIVALDHIGFGLSDQASYEMVSMDHADNLLQLIRHLNLKNVTLVVHDWGGPIGIGAFLKEAERVSNLVLTNTTVFPIPKRGITYTNYPIKHLPWSFYPRMIPDYLWGSFAAYAVYKGPSNAFSLVLGLLKNLVLFELGIFPRETKAARVVFREQFKTKTNARSSKRLVRQTPYWAEGNRFTDPVLGERDTGPFYRLIQENIERSWGAAGQEIGAAMICGAWDPLAKDEVIAQWKRHLPQLEGQVQRFTGVGHFVEEVHHDDIAEAIVELSGL